MPFIRLSIVLVVALLFCLTPISSLAWYPLNDTGIQFCGQGIRGDNVNCTGREPRGQDAHYGRDALAKVGRLTKVGSGAAGFDFTKISNSGNVLPATARLGSGPNDWACTRDNVTGITWEVKVNNSSHIRHKDHTYTWYFVNSPDGNTGNQGDTWTCNNTLGGRNCNTENYANFVNQNGLCGHTDWRVPTVKELESILFLRPSIPKIDVFFFPNTSMQLHSGASSTFWSSSPGVWYAEGAYGVHFKGGQLNQSMSRNTNNRVRLARGGRSSGVSPRANHCLRNIRPSNPNTAYRIGGNGRTVTDTRTGLMWKRCSEGQNWNGRTCIGTPIRYKWADALSHAESHVFAGYNDWRLPNIKELRSLVEECRSRPSINISLFPATPSLHYISSSPDSVVWARCVSFGDGGSLQCIRSSTRGIFNVRLVRNVNSGPGPTPQGLRVTIEPPQARQAGAAWRKVGTQAWRQHGFMERLAAGSHIIEFKQLQGWRQPPNRRVGVQQNRLMTVQARYTRN